MLFTPLLPLLPLLLPHYVCAATATAVAPLCIPHTCLCPARWCTTVPSLYPTHCHIAYTLPPPLHLPRQVVYRYPILLDAVASEMQRQGDSMMAKWAEVMTCMQPKTYFLMPHVALPLGISLVREVIAQYIFKKPSQYNMKA